MNLLFVTNARFSKSSNGNVYGYHTSINYTTFLHYLKVFDKVIILARIERANNKSFDESIRVNKGNVEIIEVPYFIGPKQYLSNIFRIRKVIRETVKNNYAIICRVPGTLGRLVYYEAKKLNKPYAVEVAADPYDIFAPGSFSHPLRIILRFMGITQLKKIVKNSHAALYVTAHQLQKRYPVKQSVFQTHASNVLLHKKDYVKNYKKWLKKDVYNIISMGSLEQMYKAPDILIKATQKLNENPGIKINLLWLGDGKYRSDMDDMSVSLKCNKNVSFPGLVKSREKIQKHLDASDLFVLPSRTEGLPRAMLEAMARGLPCIGSNIGGIPELLSEEALVPINNAEDLARKIEEILLNEELFNKLADENLIKSHEYSYDVLNERRFLFYMKVKELTLNFNNIK